MSAESPRRCRVGGPIVVPPQPPSDRSLMDTVSGFINDVTLTNSPTLDAKDVIQWARFESDIEEPRSVYDADNDLNSFYLVVGYGTGVQVWSIQGAGEAHEVLSWRQGSVRVLRILPTPSKGDQYAGKRPLIALCDSAVPGVPYCSLSFISLSGGDQVKSIMFKNPILDVLANRRSIVVSFSERLAVFDACTLEDRLTVTTCYPAPCPLGGATPINPIALGERWLAYAEKKLMPTKRSGGGCEGEGVSSYTATVLHAAKSLGKGLRGLGESVASSLGGTRVGGVSQSPSPPNSEQLQSGVVTIIDIQGFNPQEEEDHSEEELSSINGINESVVAHFVAHSESIIAMKFDMSGMILITADKRGHDFHVFRIHPHPSGPTLASVHHLYILHRGDTTAKVQDISISVDCRWTAISTLRGTTHVFPITPYGGPVGVRTHTSAHVVNRLSRFHRSAGLAADGRSSSPVGENIVNSVWYPNPRLPPFPAACMQLPMAQLRPVPPSSLPLPTHTIMKNSAGRQRLSSLSEEGQLPLAVCSRWTSVRAPPAGPPSWVPPRTANSSAPPTTSTHSLFIMSTHGYLLHYYIHPKHVSGIPKEKVCDDTNIDVEVEIKAQWALQRPPTSHDILAPLPLNNILVRPMKPSKCPDKDNLDAEDRWLSQVEIMTHAGPHRRLWMGPQFTFKIYNAISGTNLSLLDSEAVEVGTGPNVARSNPVNMPGGRPIVPVLIESGSASSLEHSPRLSDAFRKHTLTSFGDGDNIVMSTSGGNASLSGGGEGRLKEDLAEAMKEADRGCEWSMEDWSRKDEVRSSHVHRIVNPLGTVTSGASSSSPSPPSAEKEDNFIMSNDDEALFRPVVSAPRSLNAPDTPPTRPLTSTLLLPAQRVSPDSSTESKSAPPSTLSDCVVIPAKLTHANSRFATPERCVKDSDFDMNPKPQVESKIKSLNSGVVEVKKEEKSSLFENVSVSKEVVVSKETVNVSKSGKKQKNKDKKKDEECSVQQPSERKKTAKALDTPSKRKDGDKCGITPIMESYVDEISKAVESIEFVNNEVVKNDSGSVVGYGRGSFAQSPFPCKAAMTYPSVRVCTDVMQDNLDVFDDISASPSADSSVTLDVSTKASKNTSKEKDKKLEEDAAWEMLADIQSATKYEDIVTVEKNTTVENTGSDEVKKKKRGKSNKSQKAADGDGDALDTKKYDTVKVKKESEPVVVEESVGKPPKVSWSSIASSEPKKKDTEVVSMGGEKIADEPSDSKVSKVYTKNNIVLALCDTPQKDLCFVDEHHSFRYEEPPPLEPLDFDIDDHKLREVSDSILDCSDSPPSCGISTPNLHFDVNDFVKNYAYTESAQDPIDEFDFLRKTTEQYSRKKKAIVSKEMEDSDDFSLKQCESKLLVLMEKSSDEENVSPASSQTESDDCANMANSGGVNFIEEDISVVVEEPVTILAPALSAKGVKKKSKRKRR